MRLKTENIFEALPADLSSEVTDDILQHGQVRIERIVSKGHVTPDSEWYDQQQNEWIIVLSGEAILLLEDGQQHHLVAGSYMNLPAHTKHQVKWTIPEAETVWIAVYY